MTHSLKPFLAIAALGLPLALVLTWVLLGPALAQSQPAAAAAVAAPAHAAWAMIGAALAAGLSSLGAAYAVAMVGAAAVGAMVEKPELLGRLLIVVGLAEGIAIYGLIVAVLILNKV